MPQLSLTIVRLNGTEEAVQAECGDVIPGNWRHRWVSHSRAVLVEVEWLDFFGGSGFRVEAL